MTDFEASERSFYLSEISYIGYIFLLGIFIVSIFGKNMHHPLNQNFQKLASEVIARYLLNNWKKIIEFDKYF